MLALLFVVCLFYHYHQSVLSCSACRRHALTQKSSDSAQQDGKPSQMQKEVSDSETLTEEQQEVRKSASLLTALKRHSDLHCGISRYCYQRRTDLGVDKYQFVCCGDQTL